MNEQQLKDAALMYCQGVGINPDELVPSPKDQSTMVSKVSLVMEMMVTQFLFAHCIEETLKKAQQEAK